MKALNLFKLFAEIVLDTKDYEKGLDDASDKTSDFADKLKTGLATAAKVGAAALTAAATGVAALTKVSIDQYAEYEQLVGGVDTLFKEASDTVQQYAANAFQTAGMSANEYMDTVTSFSASLLQGLGGDTAQAAEYANRAVTDMADNANKMGTDLTMIQNAYQGFAKQNYTMLDNLKLGYGGTQEEMKRLIADAAALTDVQEELGVTVDANSMSFDNIVNAISVVQSNMGIMGTTSKEAASTIQGSIASMQAAWTNFLTGMADPDQDFDALLSNLVDSVVTVGNNLIPRIQMLLPRLAEGLTQLVQGLLPYIPTTLQTLLPTLIDGAAALLNGFVAVLPDIITTALNSLPQLLDAAVSIVTNLVTALVESAGQLAEAGGQLLEQVVDGIVNGIPDMVARLPEVIDAFLNFITEHLPDVLDKGVELLGELAFGIIEAIPDLVAQLPEIITSITEFFTENFPKIVTKGGELLGQLIVGILGAIPEIAVNLPKVISALVEAFKSGWQQIKNVGKYLLEGLWSGISEKISWLTNKVTNAVGSVISGVKNFLGIASPSKVFAQIGGFMAEGLGEGWANEFGSVKRSIENGMDFGTANVDFAASGLGRSSNGLHSALQSVAASVGQNFTITVQSVLDGKVIGESAYQYSRNKQRAYGM